MKVVHLFMKKMKKNHLFQKDQLIQPEIEMKRKKILRKKIAQIILIF